MEMKGKRGQSALEYLMTYGWALVVIVIVVAALVFLINPSQVGSQSCTGFQNMPIGNFQFSAANGLSMIVTNQTGRALSNVEFGAEIQNAGATQNVNNAPISISANAQQTVTLDPSTDLQSGSVTVDLNVLYWDGDFNRTATATCKGTI